MYSIIVTVSGAGVGLPSPSSASHSEKYHNQVQAQHNGHSHFRPARSTFDQLASRIHRLTKFDGMISMYATIRARIFGVAKHLHRPKAGMSPPRLQVRPLFPAANNVIVLWIASVLLKYEHCQGHFQANLVRALSNLPLAAFWLGPASLTEKGMCD